MIELVTPDLGWMETFHDSEEMDHPAVIQPGRGEFTGGDKPLTVNIEAPHTLLLAPGLSMVHRGTCGLIESAPPAHILAMAVQRFWATPELRGIEQMTLDGLIRWCEAAPALTGKRCPRCGGKRIDPSQEKHPDDDSMLRACLKCDGHGVIIGNFDEGLDKIGTVQIDRRLLLPILRHLRGDEVALGIARSVNGLGAEAHIRPFTRHGDQQNADWGDWRIQMDDFTPLDKLVTPA
jgi:hypothetical protein